MGFARCLFCVIDCIVKISSFLHLLSHIHEGIVIIVDWNIIEAIQMVRELGVYCNIGHIQL